MMPAMSLPGTVSAALDDPSVWSRRKVLALRLTFGFTLVIVAELSSFVTNYLVSQKLQAWVSVVIGPVGRTTDRLTWMTGAFVISRLRGDHSPLLDVRRHYGAVSGLNPVSDVLGMIVIGAAIGLLWHLIDRRRVVRPNVYRLMRLMARYALALVVMVYAMVKVVPTQFGVLTPGELLQPYGQLARFWVLWDFMAVSAGYTVFTGLIELIGAMLLFFPGTVVAGALLLGAALTNVFAMDVFYRIGTGATKVALQLLVLNAVVLAPYVPGLVAVLRRRAVLLPHEPGAAQPSRRSAWIRAAVLVCLILTQVQTGVGRLRTYGSAGLTIRGVFTIETFERNGIVVSPLATDSTVWKRVASDGRYNTPAVSVEYANGDVRRYDLTDNATTHEWVLNGTSFTAHLHYDLQPDGSIVLDGRIGTVPVHMVLRRVDPKNFPVL
jgi:hypothetical protein